MAFYIYGFVAESEGTLDAPPVANPNGTVRILPCDGVGAVVSESVVEEYDPLRRNVIAHQRALEAAMDARGAVLPMRFGTVVESREELTAFGRKYGDRMRALLTNVEGRVEVGVKTLWDADEELRRIADEDPEIAQERAKFLSQGGRLSMEQQIDIGKRLEERLNRRRDTLASEIVAHLASGVHAVHTNEPRGDDMILDAAFLVARDEEADLEAKANELDARYEGQLDFRLVGPLPPYSFVDLRLEGASATAAASS